METVRLLIADDHPHFRAGLRALLLSAGDLELVGEAQDGRRAIGLALELQPDVIMMDHIAGAELASTATGRIWRSPHFSD